MNHIGTQQINTQRLILRRVRSEDGQAMFANWASDPEVTRFLSWPAHENVGISQWVTDEWVKSYEKPDFYQWGIEFDGVLVGTISVVDVREDTVEVGYCIGKAWWHQGIASEALSAVIAYLLDRVGACRVEAVHDVRNPNSGAVMRKCGMKFAYTRSGVDRNNMGVCDVDVYGIDRKQ